MTLITLGTAWLIGIAAAHIVSPPLVLFGLLAVLPLAGFVLWRDDPKVRQIAACGLFLLLGSTRYTLSLPELADPGHIAAYRDQGPVALGGRVVGELDVRDTYTNLRLVVDRVQTEQEEHLVKGRILVRAPRYPAYRYGDELEVEGKLETPPAFEDFSYRDYLARRGMHGMVGWPKITLLLRGGGSPVYRALVAFKARTQTSIARILPEPEASLLTGILLGVDAGIPERVKDAFSTSGTMHVVAISGSNISLVAQRGQIPGENRGVGTPTPTIPAVTRSVCALHHRQELAEDHGRGPPDGDVRPQTVEGNHRLPAMQVPHLLVQHLRCTQRGQRHLQHLRYLARIGPKGGTGAHPAHGRGDKIATPSSVQRRELTQHLHRCRVNS